VVGRNFLHPNIVKIEQIGAVPLNPNSSELRGKFFFTLKTDQFYIKLKEGGNNVGCVR